MNRVNNIMANVLQQLDEAAVDDLALDGLGGEEGGEPDIADPQPGGDQAPPDQTPAPMTSKGEEYLLKLAYLALFFTPKEDEMIQIKNAFEASGIHSEKDIQAEKGETIQTVKNMLVNYLGSNNTTQIADELNDIEGLR